ncbi:hypothetical protein GCK72_026167 [Caenorhabditis remanei]|uniref:Uncharacterized protein n=1 Tax=Caenorhabditis remanei TaxID=31234 RepID=A0A6A5G5C2_CAERE|nr:hypothetical protein GCK72_026167 [Caenorhabditis remanei]KAF1749699.1 hypothetical protein GCK72_026167 [Caenorhabditis remanei]
MKTWLLELKRIKTDKETLVIEARNTPKNGFDESDDCPRFAGSRVATGRCSDFTSSTMAAPILANQPPEMLHSFSFQTVMYTSLIAKKGGTRRGITLRIGQRQSVEPLVRTTRTGPI